MRLFSILLLLFFSSISKYYAQQPLAPGSIAFLAIQTDSPDAFAFVTLQDVAAFDTIYFTDNGWSGTAFFTNEQTIAWYCNQPVPRGTVIKIIDPGSSFPNADVRGPGNVIGKFNSLSASGEQILSYHLNAEKEIIHLAGISTRNWLTTCNTTGTGNTNASCLPSTLTNGVNAFAYSTGTTDTDNLYFKIEQPSGTFPESILELINGNKVNWKGGNDTATAGMRYWPDWYFDFNLQEETPKVRFDTSAYSVIEGSSVEVKLRIRPVGNAGEVHLKVINGQGVSDTDFYTIPASSGGWMAPIVGEPGIDSLSFYFFAKDNATVEGSRTVSFMISNVSSGLAVDSLNMYTILTIEDDDILPVAPTLFINELMSFNTATIQDESGEFDDWFEIFNPGAEPVNLAGWYISDDKTVSTKYQFNSGDSNTVIAAGGYKLVWADEQVEQGVLHTNFKLSSNGEFLGLYAAETGQLALIDSVSFPAMQADYSFGRKTDGGLPWIIFTPEVVTPQASNQTTVISELSETQLYVYPNPSNGYFYIEGLTTPARLYLYDISGKLIRSEKLLSSGSVLNAENLLPGVYQLLIQNQGTPILRKLIVTD